MNREEALDRTLRLIREELADGVDNAIILDALADTNVVIASDVPNASSHSAQTAIVTTAMLLARCGLSVWLDVPDLTLLEPQPPLASSALASGLAEFGEALAPLLRLRRGQPNQTDVAIIVGDSPYQTNTAELELRLNCTAWSGRIGNPVEPWYAISWPFGGMAASAIAAAEAFKFAMQRLRPYARAVDSFDAQFRCVDQYRVSLAPESTSYRTALGAVDIISAGAVSNAALFALLRIPTVTGLIRIIEPQTYDVTNHNRCLLMGIDSCNKAKADDMVVYAKTGLNLVSIASTFQDAIADGSLGMLAPYVLVGVDDIPTRWDIQSRAPHWLGVGATSHWCAMSSCHFLASACARCLHPYDDGNGAEVAPTISFVSFSAGLWIAAYLIRALSGTPPVAEQAFIAPTAFHSKRGVWTAGVAFHPSCPIHGPSASNS